MTLIHRTPTGIKLAGMIACTIAVFSGFLQILAATSFFLIICAILARTTAGTILATAKLVIFYGLFIVVFRLVGKPVESAVILAELGAGAFYTWQLACVILAGTIFYETTGTIDIAQTLQSVQKAVRWRKPLPDVAFLLSLTIGFIPRIFGAWADLEKAWAAREGNRYRGPNAFIRRTTTLVPLLVLKLLSIASDTDRAIRNRSR
jgi:ABC-type cobalt transport system, permease component CbiQ and related transporters